MTLLIIPTVALENHRLATITTAANVSTASEAIATSIGPERMITATTAHAATSLSWPINAT